MSKRKRKPKFTVSCFAGEAIICSEDPRYADPATGHVFYVSDKPHGLVVWTPEMEAIENKKDVYDFVSCLKIAGDYLYRYFGYDKKVVNAKHKRNLR